ncbi:MAG: glycine betaine ABC transporter substrate-binding protein [Chloroflexota bacterium]|jgi:glycine betaine/proline transport system substrate-binding protein
MRTGKWKKLAALLVAVSAVGVGLIGAACASTPEAATPGTAAPEATSPAAEKSTLKLADTQFDSLWLNNAIGKFVIEKGYGYPVETVELTTPLAETALARGEIDIWLELWQQNWKDTYDKMIAAGDIQNLGPIYEAGPQFFIVPTWVSEEYDIKTVEDLKRPDVVKLFENPENPSKGAFINCITGWECAKVNRAKFKAYGLDEYYDIVEPGSSGAMDAALAGPQKRHEPVFGYYWAPTALMGMFDWHVIEEPEFSKEVWAEVEKGVDDESYKPKEACAYESLPIDIGIHKDTPQKAPDVVEMLKKMDVGLEPINKTLAWAKENDVQPTSEEVAVYYLKTFEDRWTTWMPAENAQKIKEALAKTSY